MRGQSVWVVVLLGCGAAAGASAQAVVPSVPGARLIATDTLRDVAITTRDALGPVVYYNPDLLERVGPRLARFFLAHEAGHVAGGHGGGALAAADPGLMPLRHRAELAADCHAARTLATADPDAVHAALSFFLQLGPARHDRFHPTGAQRAAQILACLPEEGPPIESETP